MRGTTLALLLLLLAPGCADETAPPAGSATPVDPARDWLQWGQGPERQGRVAVPGQRPLRVVAEMVLDPFVAAEKAEGFGNLLVHYAAPLVVGRDVVVVVKGGNYSACSPPGSGAPAPCGPGSWGRQTWSVRLVRLEGGRLVEQWSFTSDWKPVPAGGGVGRWEPVFHPAIAGDHVLVPGAQGSLYRLDRSSGTVVAHHRPLGSDPAVHLVGPIAVDSGGTAYYNALRFDLSAGSPWDRDALGAWLVQVSPDGATATVAFADLVPAAPRAGDGCESSFDPAFLPWPPFPNAVPPFIPCGSQRPGVNVAPAVAPDGTVYTASRAHRAPRHAYLVAVGADLRPRWAASLRDRLEGGCDVAPMPPSGTPGGCRAGSRRGVDPATNGRPAGLVPDTSTSSPVVAPDGSVLFGAFTRYNFARGHLLRFRADGVLLATYGWGWDITPAVVRRAGGWSIVTKENGYPVGSYCSSPVHCPPAAESYFIRQLSPALEREWSYRNTSSESCVRRPDGTLACVDDHPDGFEWCVNAPAVDQAGRVYANAEDGRLFALDPGGVAAGSLFLDSAQGAAYTPVVVGRDGLVYAQNNGRLFIAGE